jgi:hypothetical protein
VAEIDVSSKSGGDGAIHVAILSRPAYVAIRELSKRRGWSQVHAWMPPGDYLLLIERLRRTADSEEVFPMGKWATIQRMQEIFDRHFSAT